MAEIKDKMEGTLYYSDPGNCSIIRIGNTIITIRNIVCITVDEENCQLDIYLKDHERPFRIYGSDYGFDTYNLKRIAGNIIDMIEELSVINNVIQ